MASKPYILSIDTSAAFCAAVVFSGETLLAERSQEMSRGQAEALMPMVTDVLQEAQVDWSQLAAIACCTGPGNFTGIRLGISAARAIAFARAIPAIGVGAFEAMGNTPGLTRAATGGQRYVWDGQTLQQEAGAAPDPVPLAREIALIALRRLGQEAVPPSPIYLRAPDAALPAIPPPRMLD